jgi:hypothetical protein
MKAEFGHNRNAYLAGDSSGPVPDLDDPRNESERLLSSQFPFGVGQKAFRHGPCRPLVRPDSRARRRRDSSQASLRLRGRSRGLRLWLPRRSGGNAGPRRSVASAWQVFDSPPLVPRATSCVNSTLQDTWNQARRPEKHLPSKIRLNSQDPVPGWLTDSNRGAAPRAPGRRPRRFRVELAERYV